MRKLPIVSLTAAMFLIACRAISQLSGGTASAQMAAAQTAWATEAPAIYAILLEQHIGRQIIILNETIGYKIHEEKMERILQEMPSLARETLENYNAVNEDAQPLDIQLRDLRTKYQLISQEEIDQIIGKDLFNGWESFYQQFPDAFGYTFISRVGFNPQINQALVYRGYVCGPLCGAGYLILLIKDKGVWNIKEYTQLWIS